MFDKKQLYQTRSFSLSLLTSSECRISCCSLPWRVQSNEINIGVRWHHSFLSHLSGSVTMDEEEIREREAAILKARENLSEETLKEYREIFSFFDRSEKGAIGYNQQSRFFYLQRWWRYNHHGGTWAGHDDLWMESNWGGTAGLDRSDRSRRQWLHFVWWVCLADAAGKISCYMIIYIYNII